jgi:hypothetical protein
MKYFSLIIVIALFSCEKKQTTKPEYFSELEIYSLEYYDQFEEYNPPLKIRVSSEPEILDLDFHPSLAVKYYSTKLTVDSLDGNPPIKLMAGNLIFLEKVDGEWKSMAGDEKNLKRIKTDEKFKEKLSVHLNESGDTYFTVDYSYSITKE